MMSSDTIRPENVLLARLESQLDAGHCSEAFSTVRDLLSHYRTVMDRGEAATALKVSDFLHFSRRFVMAWIRLVETPAWNPLTEPGLPAFLYELTGFYMLADSCPDDLLDRAMLEQKRICKEKRDPVALVKMLLLWAPESRAAISPFDFFESVRGVVVAQALAAVATLDVCSEAVYRARNAAISLLCSGRVGAGDLAPFVFQPAFVGAWFRCSYADHPGKHDIKIVLNAAIVQVLQASAATAPRPMPIDIARPAGDTRPLVVVPIEWAFGEIGAMYRCYAPVLRDMRRHFYTLGMGEKRSLAGAAVSLFDQYLCFEDVCPGDAINMNTVAEAIRGVKPDMVFYPSVGMARNVMLLANLRIAPVQSMTVGHPASSRSQQMDYVMVERGFVGDPAVFSERLVLLENGALSFDAPPVVDSGSAASVDGDGYLEVAVPAVAHKLSWPFMAALRQVRERASRPVRFHFFTGFGGASFLDVVRRILTILPGSVVYPSMEYATYREKVATCHVHAASFPFGGTNSLIDSLGHGLPVVALRGREVHECIDAEFLRRLGLDGELAADSVEEYVAILVHLVDDPEFLAAMRRKLLGADMESVLMRNGKPQEFSDAMLMLLQHRQAG